MQDHETYCLSWLACILGSHYCHLDIDCNILTTFRRSSSGNCVDLLSRTICATIAVGDWCITNRVYGLVAFDRKHCWYY